MPSASANTRKLNLAFVAELIAEGATEATFSTALAKIRDRYPVVPGGDKATNKLHSTRQRQVAIQLRRALKIEDRLKAKLSAAAEGSNDNSPEPAASAASAAAPPAASAAAPPAAAPMSPEEAYIARTRLSSMHLEEIARLYRFEDIIALATGKRITTIPQWRQHTYARLAMAYESASSEAEKVRASERIHDFLMEIVRDEFLQSWILFWATSMFSLKDKIERDLKLSGLPTIDEARDREVMIIIAPFMTPAVRAQFADVETRYKIAMVTAADTAPIVKELHKLILDLYEEAVPAYSRRLRAEKYGNPQVGPRILKNVNELYAKRLAEIEESSASPGTKQRRASALLQGQKTHFQAPRWAGTKCDKMLGFEQHAGECATDAIQQIVLFADPWKNKIQPLVYNLTDANIADLYAAFIVGPVIHPDRAVFQSLLLNIQRRFQNHYNALQLLSHEEDCVPPFDYRELLTEAATEGSFAGLSLKQKKKLSGELGPSLKRELTTLWPAAAQTATTSTANILSILRIMFRLFGISYVICDMVYYSIIETRVFHSDHRAAHDKRRPAEERDAIHLKLNSYKGHTHLAFWLALDSYHPLRPMTREGRAGHATAIYCCESIWYYYDNNIGIVKLHSHLMEDLLNEVTEKWYIGTGYTADELVFYKIPHFDAAVGVEALPTKEIHYWDYTTQSWTPCLYRLIIDRHSDQFFHFGECIHIMTADHRHTGYTSPYLRYQYVYESSTERPEPKSPSKSKSPPKPKSPSMTRKSPTFAEKALLKRIANLKNVNNTERALTKRIQNLKNVNNTEKALLKRLRSLTHKKSRSAS